MLIRPPSEDISLQLVGIYQPPSFILPFFVAPPQPRPGPLPALSARTALLTSLSCTTHAYDNLPSRQLPPLPSTLPPFDARSLTASCILRRLLHLQLVSRLNPPLPACVIFGLPPRSSALFCYFLCLSSQDLRVCAALDSPSSCPVSRWAFPPIFHG